MPPRSKVKKANKKKPGPKTRRIVSVKETPKVYRKSTSVQAHRRGGGVVSGSIEHKRRRRRTNEEIARWGTRKEGDKYRRDKARAKRR